MTHPRFLFIGFNRDYINPYTDIVLNILGSLGELEYYGPGYVSKKEIEMGIHKWIESKQKFEFIIVDGVSMLSLEQNGEKIKNLFSMSSIKFEEKDYYKYAYIFRDFFVEINCKKILISNWDPHNINKKTIELIAKANPFIIDPMGFEMNRPLAKAFDESIPQSYNDNWYHFLKDNEKQIIVFPHMIVSKEFDYTSIEYRKNTFSVVGVGYFERKEASKFLSSRLKHKRFWARLKMFIVHKLRLSTSPNFLNSYKYNYFNLISESKLTYCSGSRLRYPVRKYFEIPSRGSVAVGQKCNGFEDLGFVDGENFIVTEANERLEKVLKTPDDKLQKIAQNGQKLIWNKHSDWARREQLSKALSLINENKFKGSRWEKGDYYFKT